MNPSPPHSAPTRAQLVTPRRGFHSVHSKHVLSPRDTTSIANPKNSELNISVCPSSAPCIWPHHMHQVLFISLQSCTTALLVALSLSLAESNLKQDTLVSDLTFLHTIRSPSQPSVSKQIWRSLPRRIGPKSHNRKMKNTIFFFLKLLFVSIANNFPLYHDITTVICFWSAQNTNTQCIQQCIFIKNTSYPTQTPHIKQPNGEIMQYGAGHLPKQWL